MSTLFNMAQRPSNSSDFGLGFPEANMVFSSTLAAATDTSLTVPGVNKMGGLSEEKNKFLAVFSYERPQDTFVKLNAAASAPAGAPFANDASELAPSARYCRTGDVIHFLCVAGGDVTVSFYSI